MYTSTNEYDIYYEIRSHVSYEDYYKGNNYYSDYIEYLGNKKENDLYVHDFKVESERTSKKYDCKVKMTKKGKINSISCSCPQFKNYNSCKHIAACLINYSDTLFKIILDDDDIEKITKDIFLNNEIKTNNNLKKELTMFTIIDTKYQDQIGIQIGDTKLYKCTNSKLINLLDSYINNKEYELGKNFTFNLDKYYLNDNDKKILDYLEMTRNINALKSNDAICNLIKLTNGVNLILNGYRIKKIVDEFPIKTYLKLDKDKYILNLETNKINFITNNLLYVQDKDILYKLNRKSIDLIKSLHNNNLDKLIFKKDDINKFNNSILPIIKSNLNIDNNIKDIVIVNEPITKLYFDIYKDIILCTVDFYYDSLKVNYYDKVENILRDIEYENKVINDLVNNHFKVDDKIYIDNIEDIVYFINNGLLELSNKYEIFTSEKLKKMQVLNKANVKSTFTIGMDNIMKYQFSIDDIDDKEIVNILESLHKKKKYFKLKSGNILNLDDTSLQELNDLSDTLDITEETGEIPKYQAIYLDSLKSKYGIIKTNNLFDDLITKFKSYKDSNVSLDKSDLDILRPYQIEGIKWLYNIEKTGFGGILADEMGLGKSLQTICFLKELLKEDKNYKFLIVAPTSLAYNWEEEFKKFAPDLKYKVLVGNKTKRNNLENNLDINIYITTYGLLREDRDFYLNNEFKVMIIDEAQNIKNSKTEITKVVKSVKAETKIALTGTPIENSLTELWCIFDFIMPGFLNSQKKFDSKYKINNIDDDKEKLSTLANLINPFILRRKKKDVLEFLPDKIENNIYVDLGEEQKKIYVSELNKVNEEIEEILQTDGISKARFMILQLLTKLRQICIDPGIIYDDYKGGSTKLDEFVKIVKEAISNNHKILVFTSFKTALNIAKKRLEKEKITSYVIDGSVSSKKRIDLVKSFNEDETNVFFIMLKSGGTGLNLTGADIVIHLDLWWNPQAENQATDRAHRIGQKNVVEVIKIITKGTIEEKILELQEKKKILSDKIIDANNNNNTFSKLSEKDIRNLLSFENSD